MNAITDSFYSTELGLPLFLLLLTRLDRLAPYRFFTVLAGTHNYLAGIHNYFSTFWTRKTMVHGGLASETLVLHYLLLLFGVCQHSRFGPRGQAPPQVSLQAGLATLALIVRESSQVVAALFDFLAFLLSG